MVAWRLCNFWWIVFFLCWQIRFVGDEPLLTTLQLPDPAAASSATIAVDWLHAFLYLRSDLASLNANVTANSTSNDSTTFPFVESPGESRVAAYMVVVTRVRGAE